MGIFRGVLYFVLLNMAQKSLEPDVAVQDPSGALTDVLDMNFMTTAGVVAGGVTAVGAVGVAAATAPAFVVNGALVSGLLGYYGYCEYEGKSFLPFLDSDEKKAKLKARADKRKAAKAAERQQEADELAETFSPHPSETIAPTMGNL